MKCYICDGDNWHVRKDLNVKAKDGVGICKKCGNVAFIVKDNEDERLRKHYNTHRVKIGHGNLTTTTRKLNYIKLFIMDWIKDKKDMVCCDIGAATGYFCNWLRQSGHKATGTEWGISFRRFSEHFYYIPLTIDINKKHKYDFISLYHVYEHVSNPDIKLKEYVSLLNDDGHIFISVPQWFYVLENLSQLGELAPATYFHENHINCFSEISIKNMFNKCGLEIVKEDHRTYGQTYLLKKKQDNGTSQSIQIEDWQKVNGDIDKILQAMILKQKKKYKEAIDIWYHFPEAISMLMFDTYRKDQDRQGNLLEEIFNNIGENHVDPQIILTRAGWNFQQEKYEEAYNWFLKVNNIRPTEDIFIHMGLCLIRMNKYKDAMQMFHIASVMNPCRWRESMDWIGYCCIGMKTWDERAEEEIKQQLFDKVKPNIELTDPQLGDKPDDAKLSIATTPKK